MKMNYEFKYGNFPRGLDLLGEQLLSIFDNFVTEPGVRLFFSEAGVYTCRYADITKDIHFNCQRVCNSSVHTFTLWCGVGVIQAAKCCGT